MASTYSTNLKIELMGTGDQVGSWGTTTNNNFQYALEEAIVGYGAVQFTNDANLTLSLASSNASQTARKIFLYVTSTVSLSTQRDLIVPTIEKTYIVHNNTSGSQAIRVKTSAGTGIVVPSGKKMLLYVNGVDVIEQVDYVTSLDVGTLNIGALSSPLPITSGGTGATTAANARTNLGLGTIATQAANNVDITGGSITGVSITGITDLAVADGGTGASDAATARTNLGAAPLASPTFTGIPAAPTAAPGTNTTQLATTAFVAAATAAVLQTLHPVGSIYINATNATNPGTLLGFGTWTAFGAGRVPVGFNAADPLFDTAEETGGSKDAVTVAHTHTGTTASNGAHQHFMMNNIIYPNDGSWVATETLNRGDNLGGNLNSYQLSTSTTTADSVPTSSAGAHTHTFTTDSTGSSGTNANLQPYITVYMWKRTA